jgi:sec-independent protein translocase protein TatC
VAGVALFSVAAWFFSKPLLEFLMLPLRDTARAELYFHTPYEAFLAYLKISLLAGVLAASPLVFTQLWLFVAPGLYRKERRATFPLIVISSLLFLLGAAFAFWFLVPWGLRFLLSFQTDALRPLLGLGPYFSFLAGLILACGILFDLPVVLLGLVRQGIIRAESLARARKVALVLMLILAAILTPSPDPIGMLALAFPLIFLYEGCVWAAKWVEKK